MLHVHYAVPHATAANSGAVDAAAARAAAGGHHAAWHRYHASGPRSGLRPAIRHALQCSDAITTVSGYLRRETQRLLSIDKPIDVIHNFFTPRRKRSREEVREELGVTKQVLLFHSSNLRSVKRIDHLLEAAGEPGRARRSNCSYWPAIHLRLLNLGSVARLGLEDRVIVREKVIDIEDFIQAADLGLFTSESESFCLSILEAMSLGVPSVATAVGGIPEVIEQNASGVLVPFGDIVAITAAARN